MPDPASFALLRQRLGARLRERRSLAEMTQEAAAARAGLDTRHLQKLEAGEVNVTLRTLWRLAEAYSVKLPVLFE